MSMARGEDKLRIVAGRAVCGGRRGQMADRFTVEAAVDDEAKRRIGDVPVKHL